MYVLRTSVGNRELAAAATVCAYKPPVRKVCHRTRRTSTARTFVRRSRSADPSAQRHRSLIDWPLDVRFGQALVRDRTAWAQRLDAFLQRGRTTYYYPSGAPRAALARQ